MLIGGRPFEALELASVAGVEPEEAAFDEDTQRRVPGAHTLSPFATLPLATANLRVCLFSLWRVRTPMSSLQAGIRDECRVLSRQGALAATRTALTGRSIRIDDHASVHAVSLGC